MLLPKQGKKIEKIIVYPSELWCGFITPDPAVEWEDKAGIYLFHKKTRPSLQKFMPGKGILTLH